MSLVLLIISITCFGVCRLTRRDWRNPASLNTLIWSLYCILPTLLFWRDIKWDYWGLLWIMVACFCVSFGQMVGVAYYRNRIRTKSVREETGHRKYNINIKTVRVILIILIIIPTIHVIRGIFRQGFSLSVLYNLSELLSINNTSAVNRYSGNQSASWINQLILLSEYTAPLVGGFTYSFFTIKKDKIIAVMSMLPVFLSFFLSSAKAGFIASTIGFVVTYLVGYYLANGRHRKFSIRFIRNTIIGMAVFLGVLFFSMCLRTGELNSNTIMIVRQKFLIYMFGHVKAFDEWLANDYSVSSGYTFGTMTYNWFFNLTGIMVRQSGVYTMARTIATNVHTVFRGIIHDFGLFGGLIYLGLRGLIGGYAYEMYQKKDYVSTLNIVVVCANYLFILYGFIISPWIYTSYTMAYVLFLMILMFCRQKGNLEYEIL